VDRKQLGLLGIQERASLVHGRMKIESSPETGTCLQVHIPLTAEDSIGSEHTALDLPEEMIQP
jgi:Signal transduction histidine kinase